MTIKSAALIGCLVWVVAGTFLTIESYTSQTDNRVAGGFFSYAERTPLTP
ncbi:MAG: hypothetical protein ACR2PI_09270 [Hyphomicrobiaceae bacterium]